MPRSRCSCMIFMWTPPHFWALALYRDGDYTKARRADAAGGGRRSASTKRQMLVYTLILLPADAGAGLPRRRGLGLWRGARSRSISASSAHALARAARSDDLRTPSACSASRCSISSLHFALLCIDRAPGILFH